MKLISLIILIFVFSTIYLNPQNINIRNENQENTTIWKAITHKRIYTIKLLKKTIEINIVVGKDKYNYEYKLYKKNGKQSFKFEEEELCISINENLLNLNYCKKDTRESVNEIVTLYFKKVEL